MYYAFDWFPTSRILIGKNYRLGRINSSKMAFTHKLDDISPSWTTRFINIHYLFSKILMVNTITTSAHTQEFILSYQVNGTTCAKLIFTFKHPTACKHTTNSRQMLFKHIIIINSLYTIISLHILLALIQIVCGRDYVEATVHYYYIHPVYCIHCLMLSMRSTLLSGRDSFSTCFCCFCCCFRERDFA